MLRQILQHHIHKLEFFVAKHDGDKYLDTTYTAYGYDYANGDIVWF
jgi:hypothetical protein